MFDVYEARVRNYSGGHELMLGVGERDGQIVIGLSAPGTALRCLIEVNEAQGVIDALSEAVARAKAKP